MRRLEGAEVGLERLGVLDVDGKAGGDEGVEGVEGYEADTGSRLGGGHYCSVDQAGMHSREGSGEELEPTPSSSEKSKLRRQTVLVCESQSATKTGVPGPTGSHNAQLN